jgi:1,5-anhydro-D-fructose reductase (1,5-anhydro-D-mannitol-forming)
MIRWGVIGCGDVAEVKSGPGFQQIEGSALVAVMRRDGAKAADYAQRHHVPYWFDDAQAVINHPEVDAVYIATPPGSHLDYALAVCAAGKPCYVEKPMARSHAECAAMVEAFEKARLPLFVAFYRRSLARFIKAKELVESGRIGQVTGVSYRFASASHRRTDPDNLPWRLQAEEAGGGLFLDLGCHTLDILDFLLGPLGEVEGTAANLAGPYEVEDSIAMRFRTPSGALGTAAWNFVSGVNTDIIEITGTAGQIALSTFGNEPVRLRALPGAPSTAFPGQGTAPDTGAHAELQDETLAIPNPLHIQQPLIQTIVDELHGKGACPSTGVTASRTALVMDTVLNGFYGGRNDAFWTRSDTWPGKARRNRRLESSV